MIGVYKRCCGEFRYEMRKRNCKDEDRYTPFPFFSLLLYRSFAVFIQFLLPRNKRGSSVNRRRIFETVQAAASRGDDFLLLSFTARILSLSLSLSLPIPHHNVFCIYEMHFSRYIYICNISAWICLALCMFVRFDLLIEPSLDTWIVRINGVAKN